jgi:hypothetical protein
MPLKNYGCNPTFNTKPSIATETRCKSNNLGLSSAQTLIIKTKENQYNETIESDLIIVKLAGAAVARSS